MGNTPRKIIEFSCSDESISQLEHSARRAGEKVVDNPVLSVATSYHMSGNTKELEDNFTAMEEWMHQLWSSCRHLDNEDDIIGCCNYMISAEFFEKICKILEKNKLAEKVEAQCQQAKSAISEEFVAEDGKVFDSKKQEVYVKVLKAKAVEKEQRQLVANQLARLIGANNNVIDESVSSVTEVLEVLRGNQHTDYAYQLMVNQGTDTDVADFICKKIGGVQPMEASCQEVLLSPDLASGLTSAHTLVETQNGILEFQWKIRDGKVEASGKIPEKTTALLFINGERRYINAGESF